MSRMNKNIYDLLNDTKTDVQNYNDCILTQQEKDKILSNEILKHKLFKESKKVKNTNKKMITKILTTAACAAIVLTASFGSVSAFATTNPVAHTIAEMFGLTDNLSDYATVLNQSETKNDVTVNLGEVVYDRENNKVIVATTVTGENTTIEEGSIWSPHLRLYINGEHMNTAQQTSQKTLDENTMQFVNVFMLKEKFEGDMSVNIYVSGVNVNSEYIKERWNFEFTTNGDELSQNTFTQDIALGVSLGNGADIVVEKLTINPISTSIFYSTDDIFMDISVIIKGTDNLGTPVEFESAPIIEGAYGGELLIDNDDYQLSDEVEHFTLQVYTRSISESGEAEFAPVGEEFTVNVK